MTAATTVVRRPRELILTRRFTAARELVFEALSKPEHLRRWWGPPGFPVVDCTVDFRPGGVWHYRLLGADGREFWARSVYQQIEPPEKIVYRERSSDEHGAITDERPAALVTLTLERTGEGTLFTAVIRYTSALDRDRAIAYGVERGFAAALDELEALLRASPSTAPH